MQEKSGKKMPGIQSPLTGIGRESTLDSFACMADCLWIYNQMGWTDHQTSKMIQYPFLK